MDAVSVHKHGTDMLLVKLDGASGVIPRSNLRLRQQNDGPLSVPRAAIILRQIVGQTLVVVADAPSYQHSASR